MLKVVFRRVLPVLMSVSMAASAHAADVNKVIRDVFPAAETGFDPAASNDLYSGTIDSGDLRHALYVRLSRAAVEARATRRRNAAADHRQRQDVHDQVAQGNPVRAGSGVRRQEARTRGGGRRLFAQAAGRSEAALAVGVPGRRQVRRAGRGNRGRQARRQIRLRQEAAGPGGCGQVHAPAAAQGYRLQPARTFSPTRRPGLSRAK